MNFPVCDKLKTCILNGFGYNEQYKRRVGIEQQICFCDKIVENTAFRHFVGAKSSLVILF